MAITIKSLASGRIMDQTPNPPAPAETAIYHAPSVEYDPANDANCSAIITVMRFTNRHPWQTITMNLYFRKKKQDEAGYEYFRFLMPKNLSLAPGQTVVDTDELTLEPGDQLFADANITPYIHFVLSGIEEEVT
jgi:hypothetical protein